MSTLLLVRHGQASFLAGDYDRLSPLGIEQAEALGRALVRLDLGWDRVYVGPRRRHRETHAGIVAAYLSSGLALPEPLLLTQFDEHQGQFVMERQLPLLDERYPTLRGMIDGASEGGSKAQEAYLRAFQDVMQRWVRGEIDVPGSEPWRAFRERVTTGLQVIARDNAAGKRVLAVTSGGPIAVATALALGVDDQAAIELFWAIRNAACTELRFSGNRWGLSVFNATHVDRPELLTYI